MCEEEDMVQCKSCKNKFNEIDICDSGMCFACDELDDTPTESECEYCSSRAVTNVCGTNLCEDCLENHTH